MEYRGRAGWPKEGVNPVSWDNVEMRNRSEHHLYGFLLNPTNGKFGQLKNGGKLWCAALESQISLNEPSPGDCRHGKVVVFANAIMLSCLLLRRCRQRVWMALP